MDKFFFIFFDFIKGNEMNFIYYMHKNMFLIEYDMNAIHNLLTGATQKNSNALVAVTGSIWRCISNCFLIFFIRFF